MYSLQMGYREIISMIKCFTITFGDKTLSIILEINFPAAPVTDTKKVFTLLRKLKVIEVVLPRR